MMKSLTKLFRTPISTVLCISILAISSLFFLLELSVYNKSVTELHRAAMHFNVVGTVRLVGGSDTIKQRGLWGEIAGPDATPLIFEQVRSILESNYVNRVDERGYLGVYIPQCERVPMREFRYADHFDPYRIYIEGYFTDITLKNGVFFGEMEIGTVLAMKPGILTEDRIHLQLDYNAFRQVAGRELATGKPYFAHLSSNDKGITYSPVSINALWEIDDPDYLNDLAMVRYKSDIENFNLNIHNHTGIFTDDLTMVLPFHKNEMFIVSGRQFTREEYQDGTKVCIISDHFADLNHLAVGDQLSVSFNNAVTYFDGRQVPLVSEPPILLSENSFKIVGIYKNLNDDLMDRYNYDPNTVFFPKSTYPQNEMVFPRLQMLTPYKLSFQLKSAEDTEAFKQEVTQLHIEDHEIVLHDKGYADLSMVLDSMKAAAVPRMIIAALAVLLIMIFTIYTYITRRGHDFAVMRSIGVSVQATVNYFLTDIFLIALSGTLLGAIACGAMVTQTATQLYESAIQTSEIVSNSSYVFSGDISLLLILLSALAILLLFMSLAMIHIKRVLKRPILSLLNDRTFK